MHLEENLDLVRKVVWRHVKLNPGLEFDDLFSEACIAYLQGVVYYNPEKGKFSTFMWRVVDNALRDLISSERERKNREIFPHKSHYNYVSKEDPEVFLTAKEQWEEFLSGLSPESRMICDMVVSNPEPYLPIDLPKKCRGAIARALRDKGWAWAPIWKSFREIKEALYA